MIGRLDLRHFDKDSRELILAAQAAGARVRLTRRGHALLYLGDRSACVAPNLTVQNRTAANARASVARLLKESE